MTLEVFDIYFGLGGLEDFEQLAHRWASFGEAIVPHLLEILAGQYELEVGKPECVYAVALRALEEILGPERASAALLRAEGFGTAPALVQRYAVVHASWEEIEAYVMREKDFSVLLFIPQERRIDPHALSKLRDLYGKFFSHTAGDLRPGEAALLRLAALQGDREACQRILSYFHRQRALGALSTERSIALLASLGTGTLLKELMNLNGEGPRWEHHSKLLFEALIQSADAPGPDAVSLLQEVAYNTERFRTEAIAAYLAGALRAGIPPEVETVRSGVLIADSELLEAFELLPEDMLLPFLADRTVRGLTENPPRERFLTLLQRYLGNRLLRKYMEDIDPASLFPKSYAGKLAAYCRSLPWPSAGDRVEMVRAGLEFYLRTEAGESRNSFAEELKQLIARTTANEAYFSDREMTHGFLTLLTPLDRSDMTVSSLIERFQSDQNLMKPEFAAITKFFLMKAAHSDSSRAEQLFEILDHLSTSHPNEHIRDYALQLSLRAGTSEGVTAVITRELTAADPERVDRVWEHMPELYLRERVSLKEVFSYAAGVLSSDIPLRVKREVIDSLENMTAVLRPRSDLEAFAGFLGAMTGGLREPELDREVEALKEEVVELLRERGEGL